MRLEMNLFPSNYYYLRISERLDTVIHTYTCIHTYNFYDLLDVDNSISFQFSGHWPLTSLRHTLSLNSIEQIHMRYFLLFWMHIISYQYIHTHRLSQMVDWIYFKSWLHHHIHDSTKRNLMHFENLSQFHQNIIK